MNKEYSIPYNQIDIAKGALNKDFKRCRIVPGIYCNVVGTAYVEVCSVYKTTGDDKREYTGKISITGLEKEIKRIKNALKRGKINMHLLN